MSENVILTCQDCGNKAPMKLLNKYEREEIIELSINEEAKFYDIFEFFECPVCKGYQLYFTQWNTEDSFYQDIDVYYNGKVLYPPNEQVYLPRLPSNVRNAYESALDVRNKDYAICIMAVRRTLEMVCKDQGAINGLLHQKLNHLQQKNILPPLMGDISKIIKDLGNMAAHADDVSFDKTMVDNLFTFTNKILEYIYILPVEMDRARKEITLMTGEESIELPAEPENFLWYKFF